MDSSPDGARPLVAFNFRRWIDEHRHLLKPPVGNRMVFRDSEFIIMVVGGPNSRSDFHVDPGEEFFYQLEGDMLLRTVQGGHVVDLPIREGEILLLPPNVPHSPQRFPDTVGLVIERRRRAGERDGLQWYCDNCERLLYEEFFELTDIEKQFTPVFQRFYANESARRCRHCGTVAPVPGQHAAAAQQQQ
jgi:3-hydroxyanthranilate 3,4-dioxygenase